MTEWQWSVISAMLRVLISLIKHTKVPISAHDLFVLEDAIERDMND